MGGAPAGGVGGVGGGGGGVASDGTGGRVRPRLMEEALVLLHVEAEDVPVARVVCSSPARSWAAELVKVYGRYWEKLLCPFPPACPCPRLA